MPLDETKSIRRRRQTLNPKPLLFLAFPSLSARSLSASNSRTASKRFLQLSLGFRVYGLSFRVRVSGFRGLGL